MYFKQGAIVERRTSTTTSGGTLTLINTSTTYQIFTGSAGHTLVLPDATTLSVGQRFEVIDASTGTITVQDGTTATLTTLTTTQSKIFRLMNNSTVAGVWDVTTSSSANSGGLSSSESGQFNTLAASGFSVQSRVMKFAPEEMGGNFWTTKSVLSAAKDSMTSFSLNGYGYSFGGRVSSTNQAVTERFNDDANYWLLRGNLNTARRSMQGMAETKGYAVGGFTSTEVNNVESYTDTTNVWANVASLPNAKQASNGAFYDGFGYAMGGSVGGTTALSEIVAYSSVANAWYTRTPLITGRYRLSGLLSPKNLYSAGGSVTGGTASALAEYYLSSADASYSIASMPTSKDYATSFVANGFGYMMSGSDGVTNVVATNYKLNFDTGSWYSNVSSMTVGRYDAANAGMALNGLGYGVAGSNSGNAQISSVESYQSATMFNIGSLNRSNAVPTNIAVAALLNALTPNVPVQLKTDGDAWKNFMSGGSSLKNGESLQIKFQPSGMPYVISGANTGTKLGTTYFYNKSADTWTTRATMITARTEAAGGPYNGIGYIFGGQTGAGLTTGGEKYNDITNAFTAAAGVMPSAGTQDSGADTLNGFIYFIGGQAPGPRLNTNYQYNPTLDSFATKQVTNQDARLGPAVMAISGVILAAGGLPLAGSTPVNTTETYSDVTNTWTNRGNIPTAVYYGWGSEVENFGFMVGGNTLVGANFTNAVQKVDGSTFTWTSVASISQSVVGTTVMRQTGTLFRMGGSTSAADQSTSQSYNPQSNVWSSIASLPQPVSFAVSNLTPGQYRNYEIRIGIPAFFAGVGGIVWNIYSGALPVSVGANGSGSSIQDKGYIFGTTSPATTTTQKFSPITNTATVYVPMNIARYNAGAFTLHELAYVFHGVGNPSSTLTSVERLNPLLNTFTNLTNPGIAGGGDTAQGAALNSFGYILGGDTNTATSQWNDATSVWTTKASNPNINLYCNFSIGGFIFSTGISGATTSRYNDAVDSWATGVASLNASVNSNSSLVFNGRVYSVHATSTERFADSLNAWYVVQAPPSSPNGGAPFTFNGINGYVAGGPSATYAQRATDSVKQAVLSAGLTVS